MAFKDQDGNYISAEAAATLGAQAQERIPEEKVCSSLCTTLVDNTCLFSSLDIFHYHFMFLIYLFIYDRSYVLPL